MSARVDTVALTIDNCAFISPPDAEFVVVTTREPRGPWNAHVMRTVDGHRSLFLGATGLTPETAVCELHATSAEAARGYIDRNGYALAPDFMKRPSRAPRDHRKSTKSDSSSTVDIIDLSMSSSGESLSDDETVSVASGAGAAKKAKRKSRKSHKRKEGGKGSDVRLSRSRSRSRSTTRSASRSSASPSPSRRRSLSHSSSASSELEAPVQTWVPPQGLPMNSMRPVRAQHAFHAPPPPPPGFSTWPPHMPGSVPRMSMGMGRPPAAAAPSPPAGKTAGAPPPPPPNMHSPVAHDVILRIHWVGRGYAQVMKCLALSRQNLHTAALAYVRRNPSAFGGAQASDHHALKVPFGSPGSLHLFASLRNVTPAGGEQVDLRNYQGDKLGALIVQEAAATKSHLARPGLPKFEIDVQTSSQPQPQLNHGAKMVFARPGLMGPGVSEC